MKTVTIREFQRNFCVLAKNKEIIGVVDKEGKPLGLWKPIEYEGKAVGHWIESQKNGFGLIKASDLSDKPIKSVRHIEESQIIEEQIKCDKCKKYKSVYCGESYNEEGEWLSMKICKACYKKFKPANFKKI